MSRGLESVRPAPSVAVQFSRADRRYQPLEEFEARYLVDAPGSAVKTLERTILWYTEGKGEEDIGVHHFERITDPQLAGEAKGSIACRLPRSPLSYEGVIVKIRWCVRIRLFFAGGRDFISEHVFDLGSVPTARLPPRP